MKCATNDTIAYIKRLAQDMTGLDSNCAVLAFMLDLKIPVNLHGFEYLKTAILMQCENPTMDLVNDIYPAIAETHGDISGEMIAASVRRTIKAAWDRGNLKLWHIYLPAATIYDKHPPTNAEVIAGLARILELWQGCSNAYLRQQHKEVVSSGRN